MPARRKSRGGASARRKLAAQTRRQRETLACEQLAGAGWERHLQLAGALGLPGFGHAIGVPWRGIVSGAEVRVNRRTARLEGDALPPDAATLPDRMIALAGRDR